MSGHLVHGAHFHASHVITADDRDAKLSATTDQRFLPQFSSNILLTFLSALTHSLVKGHETSTNRLLKALRAFDDASKSSSL